MTRKPRTTTLLTTKHCGEGGDGGEYGVSTLVSKGDGIHRREPCEQCPWREDVPVGVFPAEAYRTSAHTAYDAALETFSCHMSGKEKPATCAGFLLRHAANNLQVRMRQSRGESFNDVESPFPLYDTYRDMAIANGVEPDDPVLARVRGNEE